MYTSSNIIKYNVTILMAVALLCPALPARAVDFDALSLKLQILKSPISEERTKASEATGVVETTISMGEPLFVRMELINIGTNEVTLMQTLDPAAGVVNLLLENPAKKTYRVTVQRWETKDIVLEPKPFLPGERLVFETFLIGQMQANWRHEYIFPEKGRYQLVAFYNSGTNGVSLQSNPVTIFVGDPIPSWEELKMAGIVDHIEGLSTSDQQVTSRSVRIANILSKALTNPYDAWLEKGKAPLVHP